MRGVALVSVLLVVAIVTALAYEIASRHAFGVAASRQTLDGSQARHYAIGGESYARQVLYADWLDEETRIKDTLLEPWAMPDEGFEIDDGKIELRIVDLGALLNLNAVIGREGAQNLARLHRLLAHLELEPETADAWRDWVDADDEVTGKGAEDADYLLRDLPHRAANQPAIHVSELLAAVPLSSEEFERLRPHITVLPTSALKINVNTASETVLGTVAPNFPPAEAQQLANEVRDFDTVETAVSSHIALGESVAVLSVTSEFFRVQVRVEFGGSRAELTSVLHRDAESGAITLVSRSFGTRFVPFAEEEEAT